MLGKRGKLAILTLALGVSVLAALTVPAALGMYSTQSSSPGNTFTSAPSFANTGYLRPAAQAADTGGNNDGFELNPTDAYADDSGGDNSMSAQLSWDGGSNWTAAKTDTVEGTSEHTSVLGGAADIWGRIWTPDDLSNANFRVRLICDCTGATCSSRDFYLDWVAVSVYYTPP